jgi:hypothetical protein
MQPFFSSGGSVGATVEAARGRPVAAPCLPSVRQEEDDGWLGRDGGLGRPGGQGPVGRGGENWPVKKKRVGRGSAERPIGTNAEENYFRINFGFLNILRL